jgi:hypothetical protein
MGLTPPTSAPGPNRLNPATAPPRYGSPHHICTGTRLSPPTAAPTSARWLNRLAPALAHISTATGVTLQQLRWGWAHPSHNCTGTLLIPPTSSLGLNRPTPAHICTGTGLNSSLICAGTESVTRFASAQPFSHLHWDGAHPPPTSAPAGAEFTHLAHMRARTESPPPFPPSPPPLSISRLVSADS